MAAGESLQDITLTPSDMDDLFRASYIMLHRENIVPQSGGIMWQMYQDGQLNLQAFINKLWKVDSLRSLGVNG